MEAEDLTIEQAIKLVGGKRDYIHCFKNPNGMLIGADWSWDEFEETLKTAKRITKSGETAMRMNHPVAVFKDGRWNFFGAGL